MTDGAGDLDAQEYVVLRLVAHEQVTDAHLRFGTAAVEDPSAVESLVATLNPAEAADAVRAPEVFAVAPLVPLQLIAPVAASESQAPEGVAAGVAAVGADMSPRTGAGTKVAVLDTGIDATHPAFAHLLVTQRDFTGEGDGDADGHGTHCAATIAGGEVDGFRGGVASGVA